MGFFLHPPPTFPPCTSVPSFFSTLPLVLAPCSFSPKCEVMIVTMATKTSSQSGFVLIRPSASPLLSARATCDDNKWNNGDPPPHHHSCNLSCLEASHPFPPWWHHRRWSCCCRRCCCDCSLGQWCQVHSRWIWIISYHCGVCGCTHWIPQWNICHKHRKFSWERFLWPKSIQNIPSVAAEVSGQGVGC